MQPVDPVPLQLLHHLRNQLRLEFRAHRRKEESEMHYPMRKNLYNVFFEKKDESNR